jgi:hypothetical protein
MEEDSNTVWIVSHFHKEIELERSRDGNCESKSREAGVPRTPTVAYLPGSVLLGEPRQL